MHDNKVRLSQDVIEKAEQIAAAWGLKNARAAVEAVFRRYCDEYLYGRTQGGSPPAAAPPRLDPPSDWSAPDVRPLPPRSAFQPTSREGQCEALEALDELLAL